MKHLRECEYSDAYLSLVKQARVQLEHPLLSQLHSKLVSKGDFEATEAILQQAAEGVWSVEGTLSEHFSLPADGYLDQYASEQPVQVKWSLVQPTSGIIQLRKSIYSCCRLTAGAKPGMRGGHQMCMDPEKGDGSFFLLLVTCKRWHRAPVHVWRMGW